ncbi:hypothetical protein AB0395_33190 [Streptosporangium sp. NPDC051023]|uniref:hypothetical protein n=1 Tax=Streptosporangium sp. NPDC051023 TaxID=3155410 RepID=UPI003450EAAE
MITITHPEIPGSEVEVPDSSVPFHQAAGWVVKGSQDDPEVKAESEREGQAVEQPETPPIEQDKTPKGRRASTKDGE